ncbi:hypothetical protein EDM21_03725 [Paenibacillus sp. N10]|uniref:Putative sugar diacid recognition domain-containing protein n=1 Tax=Paenibacillus lutrae TaxID=2078573 RepID=A0A7X3FFJ3_9BACL|nr:hypothetical protein [Paenibacillus lutrae]
MVNILGAGIQVTKQLAGTMVRKTKELTRMNMNVMDRERVTISSSAPKRVGTLYGRAIEVVRTGNGRHHRNHNGAATSRRTRSNRKRSPEYARARTVFPRDPPFSPFIYVKRISV